MTDKPTITQADRDAAYDLLGGASPPGILTGREDTLSLIQALAKHREAAIAELQAEVERLTGLNHILSESHTRMYTERKRLENALKDISSRARSALAQEEPKI